MTAVFLIVMASVCVVLARLQRVALAGARPAQGDAHDGWEAALASSLGWLRPWLAIGPVCWLAAFAALAIGDGHEGWALTAAVLGMAPVHGLLLTASAGALRVVSALHAEDRHEAGWLVAVVAALLAGLSVGSVGRGVVTLFA